MGLAMSSASIRAVAAPGLPLRPPREKGDRLHQCMSRHLSTLTHPPDPVDQAPGARQERFMCRTGTAQKPCVLHKNPQPTTHGFA